MKITIKTKNLELTEPLQYFAEKKFGALKKYINILKDESERKTLAEVLVELEKETKHHKKGNIFCIKSKVHLPSRILVARAKSDDLLKAIVKAKDELKMEIEKYKFRIIDKRRREQRRAKRETVV